PEVLKWAGITGNWQVYVACGVVKVATFVISAEIVLSLSNFGAPPPPPNNNPSMPAVPNVPSAPGQGTPSPSMPAPWPDTPNCSSCPPGATCMFGECVGLTPPGGDE